MNSFLIKVIDDVILFIEKNLQFPLRVDVIADKTGYSKWYLQRIFKKRCNISLSRYIAGRKIFKCAMLIKYTDMKLISIANLYQFDSQQTFSRVFKKHTGMSPMAYKKCEGLNMSHLQPTLRFDRDKILSHSILFMEIPQGDLIQRKYYSCDVKDIDSSLAHFKYLHDSLALITAQERKGNAYLHIHAPKIRQSGYYMCVDAHINPPYNRDNQSHKFLCFQFSGEVKDLCVFSNLIYNYLFFKYNYSRKDLPDILEICNVSRKGASIYIDGNYLIPIV